MEIEKILAAVDHTLLQPDATWEQIRELCDDAMQYHTASVCIPPSFVRQTKDYVGDRMAICTVIGFPCGYNTTAVKVYETEDAVKNGADEIDMVINIGDLKSGQEQKVLEEIKAVRSACSGKILKVIIETCLLTEEEKITMCRLVTEAGADDIKTSTGFSTGGATFDDVKLFREHVGEQVKIKAAGGISSLADAEEFLHLGASRLGTSRVVKLLKNPSASEREPDRVQTEEGKMQLLTEEEKKRLIQAAFAELPHAYVPYSHFHVAAALLCADGTVVTGVNIENASYPATNCAERTAIFKAVSEGKRDFRAIAICGGRDGVVKDFCAPCGICRQVMREFCDPETFEILLPKSETEYRELTLKELLPLSFGPENLV